MSKPDISFIIPTIRPHSSNSSIVIQSIQNIISNTSYSYEIVIYSPNKPILENDIVWLEEKELNGTVSALNQSFWQAQGKYIYAMSDKWVPNNKIFKAITLLESDIYKDRKYKYTGINAFKDFDYTITDMPIKGSSREKDLVLPPELLDDRFLLQKHKYPVMGFPVVEKESFVKNMCNYLLNPKFKNHYHDNWISFYTGERGEFPYVCEDTWMEFLGGPSFCTTEEYDFHTFCALAVDLIHGDNLNYV